MARPRGMGMAPVELTAVEVLLDLVNAGVLALGALPPSAVPALAVRGRRRAHPFRPALARPRGDSGQ